MGDTEICAKNFHLKSPDILLFLYCLFFHCILLYYARWLVEVSKLWVLIKKQCELEEKHVQGLYFTMQGQHITLVPSLFGVTICQFQHLLMFSLGNSLFSQSWEQLWSWHRGSYSPSLWQDSRPPISYCEEVGVRSHCWLIHLKSGDVGTESRLSWLFARKRDQRSKKPGF